MNWRDRLQRRFGWLAVENLTLYIVAANGLVYLFDRFQPGLISWLILDPSLVMQGQVWRLLTFLFVPPAFDPASPLSIIYIFFWLYLLHLYGSALEQEWGSFPFTLFYIVGALCHILSAFVLVQGPVSNFYLNLSLFLAFAVLFPDMELLIFFILPVKVKYLAILTWVWTAGTLLFAPWSIRLATIVNLGNYLVFFGPHHFEWVRLKWEVHKNRRRFR